MKFRLDKEIDGAILEECANEAICRFPYFRVQAGLDRDGNYTILPNDRPLSVLREECKPLILGSDEVNGHFFVITYRDKTIWFSGSHSFCGAHGMLFWVKTTLFLYMCKLYGPLEAPKDLKFPDSPVPMGELHHPDVNSISDAEPIYRYNGGDSNLTVARTLKYLLNPFVRDCYYYEIEIPSKKFMAYAKDVDGSPNSILTAIMFKVIAGFVKEKEDTHISGRIAADYRNDIGAAQSYRDYTRFIHVKYDWSMKDRSVKTLNQMASTPFRKFDCVDCADICVR